MYIYARLGCVAQQPLPGMRVKHWILARARDATMPSVMEKSLSNPLPINCMYCQQHGISFHICFPGMAYTLHSVYPFLFSLFSRELGRWDHGGRAPLFVASRRTDAGAQHKKTRPPRFFAGGQASQPSGWAGTIEGTVVATVSVASTRMTFISKNSVYSTALKNCNTSTGSRRRAVAGGLSSPARATCAGNPCALKTAPHHGHHHHCRRRHGCRGATRDRTRGGPRCSRARRSRPRRGRVAAWRATDGRRRRARGSSRRRRQRRRATDRAAAAGPTCAALPDRAGAGSLPARPRCACLPVPSHTSSVGTGRAGAVRMDGPTL